MRDYEKLLTFFQLSVIIIPLYNTVCAGMVELADTIDSGSIVRKDMQVQVLLPAPNSRNPNPKPIGEGFGFLFVFGDM